MALNPILAAEDLVVDSSVIVASYMPDERYHQDGLKYIIGLRNGAYIFHLSMLAVVEVSASIRRRIRYWQPILNEWERSVQEWENEGKAVLYPITRRRMERSVLAAQRYRLRGADSVIAALSEELGLPLKTFDHELLLRGPRANQ